VIIREAVPRCHDCRKVVNKIRCVRNIPLRPAVFIIPQAIFRINYFDFSNVLCTGLKPIHPSSANSSSINKLRTHTVPLVLAQCLRPTRPASKLRRTPKQTKPNGRGPSPKNGYKTAIDQLTEIFLSTAHQHPAIVFHPFFENRKRQKSTKYSICNQEIASEKYAVNLPLMTQVTLSRSKSRKKQIIL